jgi:hypothetical protein
MQNNSSFFAAVLMVLTGLLVIGLRYVFSAMAVHRLQQYKMRVNELRATGQRADAIWYSVGVPSLAQGSLKYAECFQPGILTLNDTSLSLGRNEDARLFELNVNSLTLEYGQSAGQLKVIADGQAYLLMFNEPSYSVGKFWPTLKAMRWIHALKLAGVKITTRSLI